MTLFQHKLIFTLLLIGSLCISAKATHIIGGEMYYECVSRGQYIITLIVYRDCQSGGAPFDSQNSEITTGTVSVFRGSSRDEFALGVLSQPQVSNIVASSSNPCLQVPSNVCTQRGEYTFELNLPISSETYTVAYQRCCRNPTINNIINPSFTGTTLFVEITPEAQAVCNSSPRFTNFTSPALCTLDSIKLDQLAIDADGDSLVYELCPSVNGGSREDPAPNPDLPPPYGELPYQLNFSATSPLGIEYPLTINSTNGLLTGVPEITGQFVVTLCVNEFRDGMLLSRVRREFQFNVVNCELLAEAIVEADVVIDRDHYVINHCDSSQPVVFQMNGNAEFIDEILWQITLADGSILESSEEPFSHQFSTEGTYFGKLLTNPGSSQCDDEAEIQINVSDGPQASFELTGDACKLDDISITNMSTLPSVSLSSYILDYGDGTAVNLMEEGGQIFTHKYLQAGSYNIKMSIEDIFACRSEEEQFFEYYPINTSTIINGTLQAECAPFRFDASSINVPMLGEGYEYTWDFGDGQTSAAQVPMHLYENVGIYTTSLSITSISDCDNTFDDLITFDIRPTPEVSYTYSPNPFTKLDEEISFEAQATEEARITWDFEDFGIYRQDDIMFNNLEGITDMNVSISAISIEGCEVVESFTVPRIPILRIAVPNVISSNSDRLNDDFLPTFNCPVADYSLKIFDRWGRTVFESNEYSVGWSPNEDDQLVSGVYVWTMSYLFDGQKYVHSGDVTLVF